MPISRERFFEIDIAALSDHVGSLVAAHEQAGKQGDIQTVLEWLRGNIKDPRWDQKIAYHKAMSFIVAGDRAAAKTEFEKLGEITPAHSSVELMQMYIDLYRDTLGFDERGAFFDAIIEKSESPSDRLQYSGARAFHHLMIDDVKAGKRAFEAAFNLGKTLEEEEPLSSTAEIWLCKTLEGYGLITRSNELYEELIERLDALLANEDWKPIGYANLHLMKGDAYRYAGLWDKAIATYRTGREYSTEPETRIFEAECLVRNQQADEACDLLNAIECDKLDDPEFADYAFTYFYMAAAKKTAAALERAEALLKKAKTPEAHFEKRRLQYLIDVKDTVVAINESKPLPELTGIYSQLDNLSRYTVLQPNFFGVGVNLNNIIDDMVERARTSERK
ncbi:hypothetical protein [Parasphingorhabdus cellanae]|uniref:Tetratricopeptide repeat protein n=1 Tax=Parasphingorhabdus cellanae TaxID=2806553 RepID=A0ABX7T9R1_9SPHN|nr:hypothetical protein [Parasphingorhabdus cellanae]QTD57299.1 hypothetical protein J4G78_07145 [Parasphingorhabdus cellanae]